MTVLRVKITEQGFLTDSPTGAKTKQKKEEKELQLRNQEHAGSAYTASSPSELADKGDLSGLPWGGPSMSHMLQTGKARESSTSQQGTGTSQETSAAQSHEGQHSQAG